MEHMYHFSTSKESEAKWISSLKPDWKADGIDFLEGEAPFTDDCFTGDFGGLKGEERFGAKGLATYEEEDGETATDGDWMIWFICWGGRKRIKIKWFFISSPHTRIGLGIFFFSRWTWRSKKEKLLIFVGWFWSPEAVHCVIDITRMWAFIMHNKIVDSRGRWRCRKSCCRGIWSWTFKQSFVASSHWSITWLDKLTSSAKVQNWSNFLSINSQNECKHDQTQ